VLIYQEVKKLELV